MERTEDIIVIARRIWEEEFKRQAAILLPADKAEPKISGNPGADSQLPKKVSMKNDQRSRAG